MLDALRDIAMERAWDLVLALAGGYLAIKDLPPDTERKYALTLLAVSVVLGFAGAPALLAVALERGWIGGATAATVAPLAIGVCAALSLRSLDTCAAILQRLRKVKLPGVDDNAT